MAGGHAGTDSMENVYNYINGKVGGSADDKWLDVWEPATGKIYARAPDSTAADLQKAIDSAKGASAVWGATSAAERACILNRLADLVEERTATFARAESIDTGKPLRLAQTADIPRVAANLRFYAGAAEHFASESHATGPGAINYTLREPLGVVACISPWNLPLYLLSWKIAPALAAGNAVIAKPSELTPVTAYLFSRLANMAGLPPGVLNILHGRGAGIGKRLVKHEDIAAVSFTGGTVTGKRIAESTAGRFLKLSLEMGGKNPSIVFADCDFDRALNDTLRAAFTNQGEVCLCGSRVLVQRDIYDRFCEAFTDKAKQLVVGDPLESDCDQGALISAAHRDKVMDYIDTARDEGGEVRCGGTRVKVPGRCANGWFVAPTVIEGLPSDSRTNREEIFGPVVTLTPFADEEEAVAISNQSAYGLAASIWGSDVSRCLRVARRIEAGLVWVNTWMLRDLRTPMGGMKESGMGREGGFESMRFFTEAKNVCIRYD